MKKLVACMLLLLSATVQMQARHITGFVIDSKDGEPMVGVTVEVLSPQDSSRIAAGVTEMKKVFFDHEMAVYEIEVENNRDYLLKFSYLGYKTIYKSIKVKIPEKMNEQMIEPVTMEEDSKTLDEVIVKATKIKMVQHGDTIVYNADAFKLSQGSMLDALIRQLPGAELTSDGVIKINGKAVSSLLLNGRDFFKGDTKTALQNLPAYTVENVKAYEKMGQQSKLAGRRMGDEEYVLDVNLKKEYKHGMMANVDGALGTKDRYLGKLFAMGFTESSRLTLQAGAQNINSSDDLGPDGQISSMSNSDGGQTSTKNVGLSYHYEDKDENYFDSNNSYSHTSTDMLSRTNSQTFLTGGDYFNLSRSHSKTSSTAWNTNNSFRLHPKHMVLEGSGNLAFSQNWSHSESLSGQFSQEPWSSDLLDSLFMSGQSERMLGIAVNRVRNRAKGYGQNLTTSADFSTMRWFKAGGMLRLTANVSYGHQKSKQYSINEIDYLGQQASQDHRNQFTDAPSNNYSYGFGASYDFVPTSDSAKYTFFFSPSYTYSQTYNGGNSLLYRLDQLAEYADSAWQLGVLPSSRESLASVLDERNSYVQGRYNYSNQVTANFYFGSNGWNLPKEIRIRATLPLQLLREKLDYRRVQSYQSSRNTLLFQPDFNFDYNTRDSIAERGVNLSYRSTESQPDLVQLLNIQDDSNPLVVTLGNPDLKRSRTHSFQVGVHRMQPKKSNVLWASLNYSFTRNAIATSVLYDKSTGKTTTQMVNINGNWNAGLFMGAGGRFDKKNIFTYRNDFSANYNNSVDLNTVEGAEQSSRSDVHNWNISDRIRFSYEPGDWLTLSVRGSANYQNANSSRSGFENINAVSFSYGPAVRLKAPWNMELSTDLTQYSRRGYSSADMNTNELVWNARLSQTFLAGKLMLALDGFDILGRLKNTQYTINSQGHTETWNNVIPRYAMLHVIYRFNLNGKQPNMRDMRRRW